MLFHAGSTKRRRVAPDGDDEFVVRDVEFLPSRIGGGRLERVVDLVDFRVDVPFPCGGPGRGHARDPFSFKVDFVRPSLQVPLRDSRKLRDESLVSEEFEAGHAGRNEGWVRLTTSL